MRVSSYRSKRRISRVGPAPRRIEEIALRPRPVKKATVDPELVQRWEQVIGRSRALRAYRTYQEMLRKGEVGTLPEILTYGWLQGRPHLFDFQSSLLGGRLIMGGAVADFIIYDISPDGLVIWRVQGDHWHSMPDRIAKDQAQKERLLRERYMNTPVVQVIDCWESSIYYQSPAVFEAAEAGVEIGRSRAR